MPLTQSFPSGSILLVRFPAQSCIVLYGNISQAMGLVAGNGLLRHHKTVLRNRYNRSFGIADVVFPYRRRCNDYPMSACRAAPTPAVVRADDPAVVEPGALECVYGSIIRRIYQRTNIECLLTIIILVPACSSIRKIFKKWE